METFRFKYPFSKFWLIFWIIIYFPFALVLLSRLEMVSSTQVKFWKYKGNRFWLYFWALFFFPFAILLAIFKGVFVKRPLIS
jgi:hypothetical protein